VVESSWKSIARTTFGASASIGGTEEHAGVDIANPPRRKLSKSAS
jgi:hypothetical protein